MSAALQIWEKNPVPQWLQGAWERPFICRGFPLGPRDTSVRVYYLQSPTLFIDIRQRTKNSSSPYNEKDFVAFAGVTKTRVDRSGIETVAWYAVHEYSSSWKSFNEENEDLFWKNLDEDKLTTEDVGVVDQRTNVDWYEYPLDICDQEQKKERWYQEFWCDRHKDNLQEEAVTIPWFAAKRKGGIIVLVGDYLSICDATRNLYVCLLREQGRWRITANSMSAPRSSEESATEERDLIAGSKENGNPTENSLSISGIIDGLFNSRNQDEWSVMQGSCYKDFNELSTAEGLHW